jgi:hypothetical protein
VENRLLSARKGPWLSMMVDVGFGESSFPEGRCTKWREILTARLNVTLARAEGPLAVALGPVVAVYGLHLVEASPAIYVIHPV